jgi:putative ABC transport system permease protein
MEFALALPLLLGAGLLLNSFLRLSRVDPGFNPAGVLTLNFALPQARYPDPGSVLRFWERLEAQAAELPGVSARGLTSAMPPDDPGDVNNFDLLDRPVADGESEPTAPWSTVTTGYFETLGIPLLEGRLFQAGDTGTAAPVVVVSRSWAARYYPGEQVVGRQLYSGGCRECVPSTVVGVVGDVKYLGLSAGAEAVYEPVGQVGPSGLNLMVKSASMDEAGIRALVAQLARLDPELPLKPVLLTARVRASLADPGRWLAIVAGFGLTAALLAALGIYGLMSYLVRQRQRELGVRLALGAAPSSITWMVVARGMKQVLSGSALGLGLAIMGARWVRASLFDVSPWDPLTLIAVTSIVLCAALISCWLPGRRAARVSLSEALRGGD